MKAIFVSLLFSSFFLVNQANAFTELSFEFAYDKQVYGAQKQNKQTSRDYSVSVAFYLFEMTALELNASQGEEETIENNTIAVTGTDVSIISLSTKVNSQVMGIGIRQAFAKRGALIRPMFSLGYANQELKDRTTFTFRNNTTGVVDRFSDPANTRRNDSVFASFALQLQLTKLFAIKGSVQSVFPAFKFDQISDDLKYTVGFSWIF